MAIWKNPLNLELANARSQNTMAEFLNITFSDFGDNYLEATMPASEKTVQPLRIINGGAFVALAETVGSSAANYAVDQSQYYCVGLEINANHIRSVKEGEFVTGRATPIHLGRKTQVWQIEIKNPEGKLACIVRHTVMVMERQ